MQLIVEAVAIEAVEVTRFGWESRVIPGMTYVTFRIAGGPAFDVDWTYLADRPNAGDSWVLSRENGGDAGAQGATSGEVGHS